MSEIKPRISRDNYDPEEVLGLLRYHEEDLPRDELVRLLVEATGAVIRARELLAWLHTEVLGAVRHVEWQSAQDPAFAKTLGIKQST